MSAIFFQKSWILLSQRCTCLSNFCFKHITYISLTFLITYSRANKERWNIKEKPPHDIVPVKGSVHVTLNRRFVEYVITNRVAADFLEWVNKTGIPDETFFATLIHNPQLEIPGSFKGR